MAHPPEINPARSPLPITPPVDSLNVFRVIVPPCSAHAAGMDMIGYYVAIVGEPLFAESAETILHGDLPVEELPHLAIRAEFPVPPGMMWVFDAPNSHLALASFSRDCLSSTAETGAVDRAELVTVESHGVLLIGLCAMVRLGLAGSRIVCFRSR